MGKPACMGNTGPNCGMAEPGKLPGVMHPVGPQAWPQAMAGATTCMLDTTNPIIHQRASVRIGSSSVIPAPAPRLRAAADGNLSHLLRRKKGTFLQSRKGERFTKA